MYKRKQNKSNLQEVVCSVNAGIIGINEASRSFNVPKITSHYKEKSGPIVCMKGIVWDKIHALMKRQSEILMFI